MPDASEQNIAMRLVVKHPVPGVTLRMQRGRNELLEPIATSASEVTFDFSLRAKHEAGAKVNFLGPYAQGPKSARFVYLNTGSRAGQSGTQWDRRAKIPLGGITWEQVQKVAQTASAKLCVTIEGRGKDGGPVCASVALEKTAWRVIAG